jgi:hypothetical protein
VATMIRVFLDFMGEYGLYISQFFLLVAFVAYWKSTDDRFYVLNLRITSLVKENEALYKAFKEEL